MDPETKRTVLAVDDEVHNLDLVRRVLRKRYEVVACESGEEALRVLDQQEVHVVLSDLRMPRMSGVELLEKVRVRSPRTQRIILSAFAEGHEVEEAIARGDVLRYLLKPITADKLLRAVDEAAAGHVDFSRQRVWLTVDAESHQRLVEALTPLAVQPLPLAGEVRRLNGIVVYDAAVGAYPVGDLLRRVQEHGGEMVVIAEAGAAAEAARWVQRGARAVLDKPVVPEIARHLLETMLARRALSAELQANWSRYSFTR